MIEAARDLRLKPVYLMGHLHALWHVALEQQEDGDLSSWSDDLIAEYSAYSGNAHQYVSLLQKHGWLDGKKIHDWTDYAGRYLKGKYQTSNPEKLAAIFKKHKESSIDILKINFSDSKDTPPTVPDLTVPDQPIKPKSKDFLSDSIEVRLSEMLVGLILDRNPKHKKPNIQAWAREIDLLIRVDGKSWDEIERVISWCQSDSFWQNNILSTKKLRVNFDQLFLKMTPPDAVKKPDVMAPIQPPEDDEMVPVPEEFKQLIEKLGSKMAIK